MNTRETYNDVPPATWPWSPVEWRKFNNIHSGYDDNDIIKTHYSIKITDCPKCASNLPLRKTDENGICKCEFCGKEVYVWD